MKKTIVFVVCVFLFWGCTHMTGEKTGETGFSKSLTPPNEIGITKLLKRRGILDQNASEEKIGKELYNYFKARLAPPEIDIRTKDKMLLAEKLRNRGKHGLNFRNMLGRIKRGRRIFGLEDVKEQPYTGEVTTIKLLILLADFSQDEYGTGPLYNQIAAPASENNTTFWVDNFNTEHYQKMLFTPGGYDAVDQNGKTLHLDSMTDYYRAQSGGSFSVEGKAYGWFNVPHSETYYGDDEPDSTGSGGVDGQMPGTPKDLVRDVLAAAEQAGVPFEDYDLEDPYDMDNDGDYYEPDGIIDHLVIIHAGVDQSEGGGEQAENAIWAHSSSVMEYIPSTNPTVDYWDGDMVAYNYIMCSENGAIGVFCHEMGHDIGLPDEYDTIYSGLGEPVGFYSLMAKGSWSGKPLGTKPASMSPWGRMILGQIWGGQWVKPLEINYDDLTSRKQYFKLDQSCDVGTNNQVLKVNLPLKKHTLVAPYEGGWEWYSGKGDELDYQLVTQLSLPAAQNIALDFYADYDIEEDWDFAFVQVSTDMGQTWTSLASARTTDAINPNGMDAIKANLPGYTGNSGGWVNEVLDLTPYAGQTILLGFRYMTDWGTSLDGFFLDKIEVRADGTVIFSDDAENGNTAWIASGWELFAGYDMKEHYYLLEWRTDNKIDESMDYCYHLYDRDLGSAVYYKQEQGMLVWYRDTSYTDNWVGSHPGHGYLGVVDAHPRPITTRDGYFKTAIQVHDAAFNLDRVRTIIFNMNGVRERLPGDRAVYLFSDSNKYWYEEAPDFGLILPDLGLRFQVLGRSREKTVALVGISKNLKN